MLDHRSVNLSLVKGHVLGLVACGFAEGLDIAKGLR